MSALNKFNRFVTDLALGVHNLNLDAVKVYLSNVAPSATHTVKADIAEIATGGGYTGAIDISTVVTQNGGTMELSASDQVITATGPISPFRYAIVFNDTPASPLDPLCFWYDYGSVINMVAGEIFTLDFPAIVASLT